MEPAVYAPRGRKDSERRPISGVQRRRPWAGMPTAQFTRVHLRGFGGQSAQQVESFLRGESWELVKIMSIDGCAPVDTVHPLGLD